LGNLRAAFLVDLYKNVIKYIGGYTVTHVMNITDVGHLTGDNEGDADHGEDKMEKWARQQGITARDVAEKFTKIYLEDLAALRIDPFDVMPRATDHIAEQIAMVQELEAKWYTYVIENDGVYMDTSKVADYGKLIGKKHMEWIEQWARVDDAGKRNVTDFALWKFNITGKKRDMEWESPRWVGFPGRHIECSAMSIKYLGNHIDLHTGGMEHIAIHHTNEICQSECSHGHTPWVNYWLHNQWLMMNGKKIAKSDGNVAYMNEVFERGFVGEDLRYFFLQAQYRSFQDFSREGLEAASKARKWLIKDIKKILMLLHKHYPHIIEKIEHKMHDWTNTDIIIWSWISLSIWICAEYLSNDFDTPKALASIFSSIKHILVDLKEDSWWNMHVDSTESRIFIEPIALLQYLDNNILKLGLFEPEEIGEIPAEIQALAEKRRQAKLTKDRATADILRDELTDAGRTMQDEKDGYHLHTI